MKAITRILERAPYHGAEMDRGLKRLGYTVVRGHIKDPQPEDIFVIWNRYQRYEPECRMIEEVGGRVVVVENGCFGRNWKGGPWYAVSVGQHNGLGRLPPPDIWMWDRINYPEREWQPQKEEIVVFAQRGMGSELVKNPPHWHNHIADKLKAKCDRPVRIREHPGPQGAIPKVELLEDLRNAYAAVTWSSTAGLKSIMGGIPTYHALEGWVGSAASMHVDFINKPFMNFNRDRLKARLATAMWNLRELESGEGFKCLLESTSTN